MIRIVLVAAALALPGSVPQEGGNGLKGEYFANAGGRPSRSNAA